MATNSIYLCTRSGNESTTVLRETKLGLQNTQIKKSKISVQLKISVRADNKDMKL